MIVLPWHEHLYDQDFHPILWAVNIFDKQRIRAPFPHLPHSFYLLRFPFLYRKKNNKDCNCLYVFSFLFVIFLFQVQLIYQNKEKKKISVAHFNE